MGGLSQNQFCTENKGKFLFSQLNFFLKNTSAYKDMLNKTDKADLSAPVRAGPATRSTARKRKVDHIIIRYEPEKEDKKKPTKTTTPDIPDLIDEEEEKKVTARTRTRTPRAKSRKPKDSDEDYEEEEEEEEKKVTARAPRAKSRKAKDSDDDDEEDFKPKKKGQPRISKSNRKNFEHIHTQVTKMREVKNAPIDIYGYSRREIDPNLDPEDAKFQTIVALLISVQTKDQTTHQVSKAFREQVGTMKRTLEMDEADLQALIKPAGLSLNKTKFIRGVARIVRDEHGGKMPKELNDILKFPGVGYKIAILYMKSAEGKIEGIGVDSNVHRVVNRLELVDAPNADQTRLELESFVDRKHWETFNRLFVGFGQQICLPRNPRCNVCLLNNLCPEADVMLASERDKKKVKTMTDEEAAELASKKTATKIQVDLKIPEKSKRVKVTLAKKK